MRSSISSSEPGSDSRPVAEEVFRRRIPEVRWTVAALCALGLGAAGVAGWEAFWRVALGVVPSYRNSDGQWAEARRRVDRSEPGATVFIGSSRMQFDIDLDVWEEETGVHAVQLALEGSNPLPILTDLADDPDFRGLLVVGVTPPILLQPGVGYRADAVDRYRSETPAQRIGNRLSYPLEETFAFYNVDFALFPVLDRQPWWPRREGPAPGAPPVRKIETMRRDRQANLWDRVEDDPAYNAIVTSTWKAILESAPPPPPEEEARRAFEALLDTVRRDVEKVRARGGEVVFVRPPSSDWFREFERTVTPREKVWEPIVAAADAVGVHFEDYPELSDVRTPEWSHISSRDKARWTRSLVAILRDRLAERGITRPELEP